jgi:transcriptional regulator with XRE-family HTH domain
MKLISNFPERLREAMGDKNVSELARSLGISKQSVSAYLNGTRKPKQLAIRAIASVLGVDYCWLCGYDTPQYPPVALPDDLKVSAEALDIARAYDRADEKSRELVELALREYLPAKKQDTASAG